MYSFLHPTDRYYRHRTGWNYLSWSATETNITTIIVNITNANKTGIFNVTIDVIKAVKTPIWQTNNLTITDKGMDLSNMYEIRFDIYDVEHMNNSFYFDDIYLFNDSVDQPIKLMADTDNNYIGAT